MVSADWLALGKSLVIVRGPVVSLGVVLSAFAAFLGLELKHN